MTVDDLLERIDAAVAPACAVCAGPLGDSPSDDFCGPDCQQVWHAGRSVALERYQEPVDVPAHVSHRHEQFSPETTPQGLLRAYSIRSAYGSPSDWVSIGAIADPQGLVVIRSGLIHRRALGDGERPVPVARIVDRAAGQAAVTVALQGIAELRTVLVAAAGRVAEFLDAVRADHPPETSPVDVRQRALQLRRNRNTGPAYRVRAPRRLGPTVRSLPHRQSTWRRKA